LIGDENELSGKVNGQNVTRTQEISYADLKRLIQDKQVEKVSIGQTYIRAIGNDGTGKVAYTTRIVGQDQPLSLFWMKKRLTMSVFQRVTGLLRCLDGYFHF
jgi:cell division protease FtsH